MRGDFSRDTGTRAAREGHRSVLLQQGRQLLDADWNEQAEIAALRLERTAQDVIGRQGAPRDAAGFAIAAAPGGLSIGPGRFYVEGLLVENPAAVGYASQVRAELLPALDSVLGEGEEGLVYLQALLRPLGPANDPLLGEPALGGADTVVREAVAWTVQVAPLTGIDRSRDALVQSLSHNQPIGVPAWAVTTGGLDADVQTEAEAGDPGPCELPPSAGYLDQLNHLFRVSIHASGAPGIATFTWTEDAGIEASLRTEGAGFALDLPIGRAAEWFPAGSFVEVLDDDLERAGLPGPVVRITSAPGALLTLDGAGAALLGSGVRLRRWASAPVTVAAGSAWQTLAKGVKIRFADGFYARGAEWTIPGRTLIGDILWPPYPTPDFTRALPPTGDEARFYRPTEGQRRYAALALIRRSAGSFQVTQDLRDRFPPLTDIAAADVRYTDVGGALGAHDVQAAIEALLGRGEGGCTHTVRPGSGWQAVFNRVPAGGNATLCFGVGNFQLDAPVEVRGKGHIRLVGAGQGTKIWCYGNTTALRFVDCASVTASDLVVAAERQAPPPNRAAGSSGITGAVETVDCGPVAIRRATLIAGGRRLRQAACIRVASRDGTPARGGGGDLTVEDCDIVCGDLAIGVLVVNAARVRVRNNRLRPRDEDRARTLQRWSDDPHLAAALGRLIFSHAIDETSRTRPVTRADTRLFSELTGFAVPRLDRPLRFFSSALISSDAWKELFTALAAGPQSRKFTDSRRVRLLLHDIVGDAWAENRAALLGTGAAVTPAFGPVLDLVRETAAPIVHAGVVIAGTGARDVAIEGNSIEGAIDGVRVGLGSGQPQARLPIERVRVADNHIRLRAAAVDLIRHGVHLGNVQRAWIVDNDIAYETAETRSVDARVTRARQRNIDGLHAEGVRVQGALGPHLLLRGNVVRRCPIGLAVAAIAGSPAAPQWLVSDNYIESAREAFRLDNRCRRSNNLPA